STTTRSCGSSARVPASKERARPAIRKRTSTVSGRGGSAASVSGGSVVSTGVSGRASGGGSCAGAHARPQVEEEAVPCEVRVRVPFEIATRSIGALEALRRGPHRDERVVPAVAGDGARGFRRGVCASPAPVDDGGRVKPLVLARAARRRELGREVERVGNRRAPEAVEPFADLAAALRRV